MNLTSQQAVKALLKKYNIRPSKRLGQNFLIDKNILDKIIQAAQLTKQDVVLEVGPGLGILTQRLADTAGRVIAVEKDGQIIKILRNNLQGFKNIEIVEGDILAPLPPPVLPAGEDGRGEGYGEDGRGEGYGEDGMGEGYKVVANLPYNIALPVIRKFVEEKNPPQRMILMLQKEVAEKICAKKSSLPKIAIEFYSKAKILFYVPKESFWPVPKVDGAVIKIFDIQKNVPEVDKDLFFEILKAGFAHPRKTILNNLSSKFKIEKEKAEKWLKNCDIPAQNRPEDLNLKEWIKIVGGFHF